MPGLLIAFEGIDGAGKFTQLSKTKAWLNSLGFQVASSSEPNDEDSPIGKTIRKMLQHDEPMPEDPVEFQRMYTIDRAQDIFARINPFIRYGGVYLIERFAFSNIAYGMLSGKSARFFIKLHKSVIGPSMLWPHLTILVDVSGKEGAKRRAETTGRLEYYERADILEKVRKNFLKITRLPEFAPRIVVVDGEREPETVFEDVKNAIERILPTRK